MSGRVLWSIGGAIVLLSGTASNPTGDPYDRPTAYHREVQWISSQEGVAGKGLFFFQSSAKGLAARVLAESPAGHRIVLTKVLLSQVGSDRARVVHDETGWWAEVERVYGVTAPGLWEFFRKAEEWLEPGEGRTIRYTFRTSDGLEVTAEVPREETPSLEYQGLVSAIEEEGLEEALRGQVPAGLGEAVVFLDSAIEQVGSDADGPIEVLAAFAGGSSREASYAEASWTELATAPLKGLLLSEPESLRFAERFRTIQATQPLPPGELDTLAALEKSP
jgi:hypothetical protein